MIGLPHLPGSPIHPAFLKGPLYRVLGAGDDQVARLALGCPAAV